MDGNTCRSSPSGEQRKHPVDRVSPSRADFVRRFLHLVVFLSEKPFPASPLDPETGNWPSYPHFQPRKRLTMRLRNFAGPAHLSTCSAYTARGKIWHIFARNIEA